MLKEIILPSPVLIEDIGMIFPTEVSTYKKRYGLYKCKCGSEFKAHISSVNTGNTKSCGCHKKQKAKETHKTHGLSSHRLYIVWHDIISRTNNKNHKNFKNYGGRGITICDRWKDINNFIEDMYPTFKEGLTIDRIDNDLGYIKDNCRWATKEVQARNTRLLRSNNTSGYRGVSWNKPLSKWESRIWIKSKKKTLGYFNTSLEAAQVYDKYVIENKLEHTINGVNK